MPYGDPIAEAAVAAAAIAIEDEVTHLLRLVAKDQSVQLLTHIAEQLDRLVLLIEHMIEE